MLGRKKEYFCTVNVGLSRNFWLLCIALLFFMISFNLIIPELNDFITRLGGAGQKGLIIFLFSVTAAISRPFAGKLSDTIGRKKVMFIGIFAGVLVGLMYSISATVFFFLMLRLAHGFSAGFLPTGATALVTDIVPEGRRGTAMGIWGTFISVGFGVGNWFSHDIMIHFGYSGLFTIAASFCIVAGVMIGFIKETLPNPQPFKARFLLVGLNDIFEPSVRPAAFVMLCSTVGTGFVFVTTSDISKYLHIDNKGYFFLFYMLSTILVRIPFSSLSEHIDRRKTMIAGLSVLVTSLFLIATSTEWVQYTVSAILFGVSTGITSPTIMAWMADLCPDDRRGVGSGTLFIALEIGVMTGSGLSLLLYDNTFGSIALLYFIGSAMALIAIVYLIWHLITFRSKS